MDVTAKGGMWDFFFNGGKKRGVSGGTPIMELVA
jgi:hypothetical protein